MNRRTKASTLVLGLVAAAALAGCEIGVTSPATEVGGGSAKLEGQAYSSDGGTVAYWFEYGPTAAFGASTPIGTVEAQPEGSPEVEAVVTGLDEGTTYHYRTCARPAAATSGGVCGDTATVTTYAGRDTVTGRGIVTSGELGYGFGTVVDARAAADGGPEGQISTSPGFGFFRFPNAGPLTCLRVEGGDATIGFVAEMPNDNPPLFVLAQVHDGGPGGIDRFGHRPVPEALTTCPAPTASGITTSAVTEGDLVVHDSPAA